MKDPIEKLEVDNTYLKNNIIYIMFIKLEKIIKFYKEVAISLLIYKRLEKYNINR
jgi:hypothetical protein